MAFIQNPQKPIQHSQSVRHLRVYIYYPIDIRNRRLCMLSLKETPPVRYLKRLGCTLKAPRSELFVSIDKLETIGEECSCRQIKAQLDGMV